MASPAPAAVAANGNGTPPVADASSTTAAASTSKENYIEGMVYPPPDIRSIVDKTAAFTAKNPNPATFEDKIRARQSSDSRFSFINDKDAYHPYYQYRVKFYREGGVDGAGAGSSTVEAASAASKAIAGAAAEMVDEGRPTVPQPRPFEFINVDRPPMAAVDQDILKLTALFTARMGRGFTSDLGAREVNNYQFDFMRPSHSLFGYFNRLVEQYTKVLMAPQETLEHLDRTSGRTEEYDPLLSTEERRRAIARREIMKEVHNRVEWEKYDNARRQAEDTAAEEERIAFASIDWQDFIVVSTIDFTEQDELLDLPPPMARSEVENMTLAQKKMAAMIMEGKDVASAGAEPGAAAAQDADDAEMQMSDDETEQPAKKEEVASEAPVQEAKAVPSNAAGPIKIRKDYVPKSQRAKKVVTTTCTICGQQIPESEMAEHVRIELLDPRWKERQMASEAKRSASNMLNAGTDVVSTLRQIASKRTDIFTTTQEDEERKKKQAEEERQRRRQREAAVWDGHTASAASVSERLQSGVNHDEQIAALLRAKGITAPESNIGPRPASPVLAEDGSIVSQEQAAVPESEPAIEEPKAAAFVGATLSAAPVPQAAAAVPAQGQNPYGQPGQSQIDPARLAQMQQQQQQYQTGQARPAEQNADSNKRQRQ